MNDDLYARGLEVIRRLAVEAYEAQCVKEKQRLDKWYASPYARFMAALGVHPWPPDSVFPPYRD